MVTGNNMNLIYVPTTFEKLQIAEVALSSRQQRCGNAVQSQKTPNGGVYFEHAQNKWALSHQSGVHKAFPERSKKLQIAEMRALQSPATLLKRCEDAFQSPRSPCDGVYFEHAQNKRRG